MKTWAVVVFALSGCHKASDSPNAPARVVDTKEADALWALAPDGAIVGMVAAPHAITMTEHAWLDIQTFIAAAPEFASVKAEMDAQLVKLTGAPSLKLSDLGVSADHGAAMFVMGHDESISIISLADRDKFLAIAHGTKGATTDTIDKVICKTIDARYVCASNEALFARLGKGNLAATLRLANARGDIEIAAADVPIAGGHGKIAAVMQLDRGAVVVRGAVSGLPAMISSKLGPGSKPAVEVDHVSGFGVVDFGPLAKELPPQPLIAGVTLAELGRAIGGPLTLAVPVGDIAFDVRMPLADPAPVQTLIDHCAEVPALAAVGAKIIDGACHVPIPNTQLQLDAWIDGKQLRIGKKGAKPSGQTAPMGKAGAEIATGEWAMALWGRGTMFDLSQIPGMPSGTDLPPQALFGIRAMAMLNELGFAVRIDGDTVRFIATLRTGWANPDDVVAKLSAISPQDFLQSKTGPAAKAIADGAPSSPFAADYKAGYGGLMVPAALIGMLSAVAIPAFLDYMKKSKRSESELELNKLGKNAKVAFIATSAFPIGDAPLTPAASCCTFPNHKCPAVASDWATPVWQALDFEIDEPHLYQYRYHSDGKTFDAYAIGDLDCDGVAATFTLHGDVTAGNPHVELTLPPPGVY